MAELPKDERANQSRMELALTPQVLHVRLIDHAGNLFATKATVSVFSSLVARGLPLLNGIRGMSMSEQRKQLRAREYVVYGAHGAALAGFWTQDLSFR